MQVSTDGGADVRWGPDGDELFYIAFDGRLVAVPIRFQANGPRAEADSPIPLFATHVGALQGSHRHQYDVSSDGERFLMNTIIEEDIAPITVILNWRPRTDG